MADIQDGGYTYGGIQTYRGDNIGGHQNIQEASKHMGAIQTYREVSKHMGAFKHTGGHFKHIWASKHTGGASKHKGGIQTYGWCPNIWGHQNIQGASKHCSRLKSVASSATHMGATKHTGGHPNIQQGIQTYEGIQIYG